MKNLYIVVAGMLTCGVALLTAPAALGGQPPIQERSTRGLEKALAQLQSTVASLQSTVESQTASLQVMEQELADAKKQVTELEQTVQSQAFLLQNFSRDKDNIYITGANLHIRDGSGSTWGPGADPDHPVSTGLGNLILGYNEDRTLLPDSQGPAQRTGSHNLVIGPFHAYPSVCTFLAGFSNDALAPYSTISGGIANTTAGFYSAIGGGVANTAFGSFSSISGGYSNTASGIYSVISGGSGNTASGAISTVSGGYKREAAGNFNWLGGSLLEGF